MARYLMEVNGAQYGCDNPWRWCVLDATPGQRPHPVAWCGFRRMATELASLYHYEEPRRAFVVVKAAMTDLGKVPGWLRRQAI